MLFEGGDSDFAVTERALGRPEFFGPRDRVFVSALSVDDDQDIAPVADHVVEDLVVERDHEPRHPCDCVLIAFDRDRRDHPIVDVDARPDSVGDAVRDVDEKPRWVVEHEHRIRRVLVADDADDGVLVGLLDVDATDVVRPVVFGAECGTGEDEYGESSE